MIETARLILRRWRSSDLAPFAALNAEFAFPEPLGRPQSDAQIADFETRWDRDGFCFGAIERKSDAAFIGMAGLARLDLGPPFHPCVEIGWTLDRAFWGNGYATEAAWGWLAYGLGTLELPEIIAFTDRDNPASLAVMRKAGMIPDPARNFDHPDLPEGHPLRPCVLYALTRADWAARRIAPFGPPGFAQ